MAFLINIPVTLTALVMAVRWLPEDSPPDRARSGPRQVAARIVLVGIIGFATSMTALVILLTGLPHISRPALAVFVLAAAPTVGWELRRPAPFFDFRGLAANGALTRTYLRHSRSPHCFSTMFGAGSGS